MASVTGIAGCEEPKPTTATRTATPRGPIPVTVDTSEAYPWGFGGNTMGEPGESRDEIIRSPNTNTCRGKYML